MTNINLKTRNMNKTYMLTRFLLFSTYLVSALSQNCYILSDVTNSNNLFFYKGSVYDTTGYNQPPGQKFITTLIGKDLEIFVNPQKVNVSSP